MNSPVCCICGKELPNRFAVAGRCEGKECDEVFCSLHWNRSNRKCREHGYEEVSGVGCRVSGAEWARDQVVKEADDVNEQTKDQAKKIDPAKVKAAMAATVELVKKLGVGAVGLLQKLKKDRSPEAMLKTIEGSESANQQRREGVAARVEQLHAQIVEKKKAYTAASPARKHILEHELSSLLAQYKGGERELTALLENERVLAQVKGRMMEVASYGMAGVSEDQIDELIDDVEEAVGDQEGRLDAARDLDKAGRRRERESDREALFGELDQFGESEESKALAKELAAFDEPAAPAAESPKKSGIKEEA